VITAVVADISQNDRKSRDFSVRNKQAGQIKIEQAQTDEEK